MLKGSAKTFGIAGILIVSAIILLPYLSELTEGTSVRLGDATLYDRQGQVVGTIKSDRVIPGSFVTPDDGGAQTCVIPVEFEVWYYDAKEVPSNPTAKVHLIRAVTVASYLGPGESEENMKIVTGVWKYEGTSRKEAGNDYMWKSSATFSLDADSILCDYDLSPGDKISFAGYLEVASDGLSAKKRSSNTITLQIEEDYTGQLIIEKVTLS